jgi:putative hemolysin
MKKHTFVISWMMLVLLWLAACTSATDEAAAETDAPVKWPDPTSPHPEFDQADVGLANPASLHCEEQGGRLEMRDDEKGSHGVCVFEGGGECEEWAFWRGECGPASDEARVNVALEAGLAQAVKLEILELDPAAESAEPYRLRLTIEDESQLGDVVRSLNTATPRTPGMLCIPTWQLRFYRTDGTLQELGYLCDAAQPTLSGRQDFWQQQEATAPASFVALVNSHLESAQEPAPGQSLNPVAQANLRGTQRIEVLLQTYSKEGGIAQASVQPLADINDPATVAAIVASLDAELPLGPRARCMANGALVFYRPDGSTYYMGYGCELESATFLRGDEGYWQGQDALAPPALRELVQKAIALNPVTPSTEETPRAVAWYGYVTSSERGDRLTLYPQGAGELALLGDEDEHQEQIAALRDKPEPGRNAHFWGMIDCDAGECKLIADRIRVDGPGPFFAPEPVQGWQGTLIAMGTEPGSGPDDAFVLAGDWPLHYGVWSEDPTLAAQLESLRDTGRAFRIWGELTAGVPDANGTQIVVTRIETLDE